MLGSKASTILCGFIQYHLLYTVCIGPMTLITCATIAVVLVYHIAF